MVQGPSVQKTIRLSSHTPEQFNVMPRTENKNLYKRNKLDDSKCALMLNVQLFQLVNFI